jgi:hypothetical protein
LDKSSYFKRKNPKNERGKECLILTFVLIISIIIIIAVILLSVLTVNKGYRYKHTIDPEPKISEEDHSSSDAKLHE